MSCSSVNEFLENLARSLRVQVVERERDHDHHEQRQAEHDVRPYRLTLGTGPLFVEEEQCAGNAQRQRSHVGRQRAQVAARSAHGPSASATTAPEFGRPLADGTGTDWSGAAPPRPSAGCGEPREEADCPEFAQLENLSAIDPRSTFHSGNAGPTYRMQHGRRDLCSYQSFSCDDVEPARPLVAHWRPTQPLQQPYY